MERNETGTVRVLKTTIREVKYASLKKNKSTQDLADEILSREAKKINAGK